MLIVRSQDRYDEFAELEPATGHVRHFQVAGSSADTVPSSGWYSLLGGQMVSLYALGGDLYLLMNGKSYHLDHGSSVEFSRQASENELTLRQNGEVLAKLRYLRPEIDPSLDEDPSGFVDEEDFDFGLFVFNVLANQDRREVLTQRTQVEL